MAKTALKHVGLCIDSSVDESLDLRMLNEIIRACVELKIRILTINLSSAIHQTDILSWFFGQLRGWDFIAQNQIKISVLGKWYSLASQLVEPIKALVSETKDYDAYFVNFCLNYDGQEEIVDACKLIARQVKLGKLDPESIDKHAVKENIYTSFFLPPDLIIVLGGSCSTDGFLLWDSARSKIFFCEKSWSRFSRKDFQKAVEWWAREKPQSF